MKIYVSSVTGNTRKVADALSKELHKYQDLPEDLVIICFWCRRGSMDDLSLKRLAECRGQRILAFGTMGHTPEDAYGRRVHETVTQAISEYNECLGLYLCQGKIDEVRTEKRRCLPPDHRHYLDDASYQRHLASRTHPDEKDIEEALSFLRERLVTIDVYPLH